MDEKETRKIVREGYAKIAKDESSCCGPVTSNCGCGDVTDVISKEIGYSDDDLKAVPDGANLGLGCGNPVALASLKEGETVLDLGSGPGFDAFLAAKRVGEKGKVIGVDMTHEMLEKARGNAKKGGYENVEFRLGEIEHLPAGDNSVDVIISNCVINLSPDKKSVFEEAFRVLKPGGRLMVSDIVLLKELPEFVKKNVEAYIGCLSGAIMKDGYLGAIKDAGFTDVKIVDESTFPVKFLNNDATATAVIESLKVTPDEIADIGNSIASVKVFGVKPE
jgi:ubiquinone/menaquinone biosynthesis C-methylase UbiE